MVKARNLGGHIQNEFSRKELLFGSDYAQTSITLKSKRNGHHLSSISKILFFTAFRIKNLNFYRAGNTLDAFDFNILVLTIIIVINFNCPTPS